MNEPFLPINDNPHFHMKMIQRSGSQFRITIPKEMANELGLKGGEWIALMSDVEDGQPLLKIKIVQSPFKRERTYLQ